MTTHTCWICVTPIYQIVPKLLRLRCTCGHELQWHCLAAPHPMPSVGCPGFEVAPVTTPAPTATPDAQTALF